MVWCTHKDKGVDSKIQQVCAYGTVRIKENVERKHSQQYAHINKTFITILPVFLPCITGAGVNIMYQNSLKKVIAYTLF